MRYRYCPTCGSKLTEIRCGDDGMVPYCEPCKKRWFDSFANCVIVLVYNECDEIVLCRQNYLSDKYMSFTSGYISPGETAEETALREVKEELGIDLENLTYAGTVWFDANDMLMHGFLGFTHKCDLKLSDEVDFAEWAYHTEVPGRMFPDRPGNAQPVLYRKFLEIRGLTDR